MCPRCRRSRCHPEVRASEHVVRRDNFGNWEDVVRRVRAPNRPTECDAVIWSGNLPLYGALLVEWHRLTWSSSSLPSRVLVVTVQCVRLPANVEVWIKIVETEGQLWPGSNNHVVWLVWHCCRPFFVVLVLSGAVSPLDGGFFFCPLGERALCGSMEFFFWTMGSCRYFNAKQSSLDWRGILFRSVDRKGPRRKWTTRGLLGLFHHPVVETFFLKGQLL